MMGSLPLQNLEAKPPGVRLSHDSQWREDSGAGLAAAFAAFYQQSREHIYFYLLCFRLSQPQAQELTQEAFVKLWQALQKEVKIENHRAWLFRVARHLALKSKAQASKFRTLDPEIERTFPTHAANPEQKVIKKELLLRILDAIGKLSPQQRECLHLFLVGLKYCEIASVMEISSSAVGEFRRRGLQKLREAAHA